MKRFRIHGDNIVECERAFKLIIDALSLFSELEVNGPFDSILVPTFKISLKDLKEEFEFTFFPGFGRWEIDIISYIRNQGGNLREAADVIITAVLGSEEKIILAIEYCGALSAGNQAWQRNGRAYSFAHSGIPYFFVTELGGFELDSERGRKSVRFPNPAVPFSYVSASYYFRSPVLPIYVPSDGATEETHKVFSKVFGYEDFKRLVAHEIIEGEIDQDAMEAIEMKALKLVDILAKKRQKNDSLDSAQWNRAYETIEKNKTILGFLKEIKPFNWSKNAYIAGLTPSFKKLMTIASQYAFGLTAKKLPFCYIPSGNRKRFFVELLKTYNDIPSQLAKWLQKDGDLVLCWIMGFKPKGDDARPDRGLTPFVRMLVGPDVDLLTIVYGPAPASHWQLLKNQPSILMNKNGLWESILTASSAIFIDSATMGKNCDRGYLSGHWSAKKSKVKNILQLPHIPKTPRHLGENDVDTILHLFFKKLGGEKVFEGMCNPPGGDWSGISLFEPKENNEYRWLTLPRVSGVSAKRPDHVIQLFLEGVGYGIVIESKERLRDLEENIGERLKNYLKVLTTSLPSVNRKLPSGNWHHSVKKYPSEINYISAVAFIANNKDDVIKAAKKTNADIIFGFYFDPKKGIIIYCLPLKKESLILYNWMEKVDTKNLKIQFRKLKI